MNQFLNLNLKRTMIVAALIALPVAHATTMSKADFKAGCMASAKANFGKN